MCLHAPQWARNNHCAPYIATHELVLSFSDDKTVKIYYREHWDPQIHLLTCRWDRTHRVRAQVKHALQGAQHATRVRRTGGRGSNHLAKRL